MVVEEEPLQQQIPRLFARLSKNCCKTAHHDEEGAIVTLQRKEQGYKRSSKSRFYLLADSPQLGWANVFSYGRLDSRSSCATEYVCRKREEKFECMRRSNSILSLSTTFFNVKI